MITARAFAELGLKLIAIFLIIQAIVQAVPTATFVLGEWPTANWVKIFISPLSYLAVGIVLYVFSNPWSRAIAKKYEIHEPQERENRADLVSAGIIAVGIYLGVRALVVIPTLLATYYMNESFLFIPLVIQILQLAFAIWLIFGTRKIREVIRSLRPLQSND